ncbi:HAD-like domain-containing protein [Exophiala viscosa]|uniref:HAD-like domain-containing protein n=1 Tax=Exophiala viscosa TaxID=2486360 RepID=UPI00219C5A7D|nr:HAD-like domain-containing protein [Exophiala viscosa]
MTTGGTAPGKMVDSSMHAAVFGIACYIQISHAAWIHRNAWSNCFKTKRFRLPRLSMDTLLSLSLLLSLGLSIFNIFLSAKSGSTPNTYSSSASFLSVVISAGRYLDVTLKKHGASGFAGLYGLQKEMELGVVMVEGHPARTPEKRDDVEAFLAPMPTTLLAPLDVYHIPPQGLIPCDSYIIRGTSLIAEANMTGESMPCRKSTGDFLMSGTKNLSNNLVAVVTKAQSDSSLEALLESIEKASEQRYDPAANGSKDRRSYMDSAARYFVPAVLSLTCIGLALTMYTLPSSIRLADRINAACERAMATLAAACPCALGLAGPSAIMAGLDACYASGILVPGGAETLETLSRLTHMVLDKTGTLTEGRPEISSSYFVEPYNSDPAKRALCHLLLCAAERDEAQAHPVGRAIFQWSLTLLQQDFSGILDTLVEAEAGTSPTSNVESIPGRGVSCDVQGPGELWYHVCVGNDRFLVDHGVTIPPRISSEVDMTTVHFAINGQYTGTVILQDSIRRNAPDVLKELKELGISLTMLTGDSEEEAQRVATKLEIPLLKARSLPNEKKDLVESLQYNYDYQHKSKLRHTENVVAMLGDGLNDAPAQAAADVGILFSLSPLSKRRSLVSSTSLALGTSAVDAIIMSPELTALPRLLRIARETARQARWNFLWAIGYNAIAISLAMGVGDLMGLGHIIKIDASLAGTMMAFSSITVLGMSLHFRQRLRESQ